MALCPQCKGSNSDDARQCVWCGLPLHPGKPEPLSRQDSDALTGKPAMSQAEDAQDPLAGLEGLLPPVPLPRAPERPHTNYVEPTEQELSDAALLYRIATDPAPLEPPREPPEAPEPPLVSRGMHALLALLVLLAVLAPLVSGGYLDSVLRPSAGQVALARTLELLRDDDRVLVAFDYAPSAAAELAPVQDALLSDLARRSVPLVALSTRPEGLDLARQSLEGLAAARSGMRPGMDYAMLGYLAGDAAGLRLATEILAAAFGRSDADGRPLEEQPLLGNLYSFGDVSTLLVFTDDLSVARRWIEQVGTRVPVPLLLVTTAAIEPMLMPYAGSGQVTALVSGALGGVSFGGGAGSPLYSADGFLALWVVLAGAFAWGLLRRSAQRRERRS